MNQLKIAVCFFGHLRTYKKCAPFLRKNLLDKYDCDLFMHTWATLDHNTKSWHTYATIGGNTKEADIIRTYREFKGLIIEEQKSLDLGVFHIKPCHNSKTTSMSIFGMDAMFHSIRASNRLREEYAAENNVKYDLVLCVRPDIWLKEPLDIGAILAVLSEEDIARGFFTFGHCTFSRLCRGFESLGGTDLLFFGTPEVISCVAKNTAKCRDRLKPNMTISYGQEYELIKLVKESGWTPYRIDLRYGNDWEIFRDAKAQGTRKQWMRIRIRRNAIRIYMLQRLTWQLLRLRFVLLGREFDFCIGATGNTI
jgi:hypothetical protein